MCSFVLQVTEHNIGWILSSSDEITKLIKRDTHFKSLLRLPDACSFIFSNLAGLGMKPTSAPSLTNLPIHQSLLYFCKTRKPKMKENSYKCFQYSTVSPWSTSLPKQNHKTKVTISFWIHKSKVGLKFVSMQPNQPNRGVTEPLLSVIRPIILSILLRRL